MSKLKEKPVVELSEEEIVSERHRLKLMLKALGGTSVAGKEVKKRLYAIEKRIIQDQGEC